MKVFDFGKSLTVGTELEDFIDSVLKYQFKRIVKPRELSPAGWKMAEKMGFDRVICTKDGFWYSVQYKADIRAGETKRFFLEHTIEGSDGVRRSGWVKSIQAQILVVLIPALDHLFVMDATVLKESLCVWLQEGDYANKRVHNEGGFSAVGIAVPISKVMAQAGFCFDGMRSMIPLPSFLKIPDCASKSCFTNREENLEGEE